MNINEMNPQTSLVVVKADRVFSAPVYSITTAALGLRDEALTVASRIQRVTDAAENALAVEAQTKLTVIHKMFEAEREVRKRPVLEAGRQLDSSVKMALAPVAKELVRLNEMVSTFQIEERRRVAEEERLRQEELNKIERQRQAELDRIAREQEVVERLAREAREKADRDLAAAKTKKQREDAARSQREASEANRRAQELAERNVTSIEQVNNLADAAKELEAPTKTERVAGQVFRDDWDIEVTNPYDLAKFHPDCVTITPLMGPIKKALKEGIALKGVKAKPKVNSTVRAALPKPSIDV